MHFTKKKKTTQIFEFDAQMCVGRREKREKEIKLERLDSMVDTKIFVQCFGGIIKSNCELHTYRDERIQFSRENE